MKNKKKTYREKSREEFQSLWRQMVETQKRGFGARTETVTEVEPEQELEAASETEQQTMPEALSKRKTEAELEKKNEVWNLNTPGLTREQRLWIAAKTIGWAVCPLLLYLLLPTMFMMAGMSIRQWKDGNAAFASASGNFYDTFGILACFLVLKHRCEKKGENFSDAATFYWKHPDWKKIGTYSVLGISLSIFLSAALTLIPLSGTYAADSGAVFQRTDLILALCSVLLIAPVSEETIFRGLMLNRLLTQFSERTAVLIAAALFAACHVNLVWILYAFCMGVLLCFVSLKEDNIFYAVILHSAFNAPTVLNVIICQSASAQKLFYGNKLFIFCYGILAFLILVLWIRQNQELVSEFIGQLGKQKE